MSALHLSRATVALPRSPDLVPRGSSEAYLLHQAVADLFGDRPDRGYLFRAARSRPGGREVLILSRDLPAPLDSIPVQKWGGVVHVETKLFNPALRAGTPLEFQIRVNATRVRRGPDLNSKGEPRQRRFDVWDIARKELNKERKERDEETWNADPRSKITPHEIYTIWLRDQLAGAATVNEAHVIERGDLRPSRGMGKGSNGFKRIQFVVADLVGSLEVESPERFRETIGQGIGRAKAFGCGLLCISRPGTVLARRYPDRAAELF